MIGYNKLDAVNQRLLAIQSFHNNGCFPNYIELYKHLVGFSLSQCNNGNPVFSEDSDGATERKSFWHQLNRLRDYFENIRDTKRAQKDKNYFFVNKDYYWTYIEARFLEESRGVLSLIKLYIPVESKNLVRIARSLFDFLMSREKQFCYKIAHQDRYDNICLWICLEELRRVIEYVRTSCTDQLLQAPIFCPEYKAIGITRELYTSFNEVIASMLYRYLPTTTLPSLEEFIAFLERKWASTKQASNNYYCKYDREIIVKSLKCILYNRCPVDESEYNITKVCRDNFRW